MSALRVARAVKSTLPSVSQTFTLFQNSASGTKCLASVAGSTTSASTSSFHGIFSGREAPRLSATQTSAFSTNLRSGPSFAASQVRAVSAVDAKFFAHLRMASTKGMTKIMYMAIVASAGITPPERSSHLLYFGRSPGHGDFVSGRLALVMETILLRCKCDRSQLNDVSFVGQRRTLSRNF